MEKERRYVDPDASTSQVLAQRGMDNFMILRYGFVEILKAKLRFPNYSSKRKIHNDSTDSKIAKKYKKWRKPRVLRRGCTGIGSSEAGTSTGVKLGPTPVSVCERCIKGKERGGGVADEESNDGVTDEESSGGNAIEALHQSVMPFVPVHRSNARADDRVDRCAIERCMKGNERGGGVADEGSQDATLGPMASAWEQRSMQRKEIGGRVTEGEDDGSGDEIDRDDDGDGGGDSDGDDDESGREGGLAGVVCAEKGRGG
ncbi:hypothetical protein Scep_005118 [Stephania cephalantha]|uniref:Uncharacterized protein n=1 Tax=Stephania cephalantha TaxID=152367 RepID=A0AAP0PXW6_9MAGN